MVKRLWLIDMFDEVDDVMDLAANVVLLHRGVTCPLLALLKKW